MTTVAQLKKFLEQFPDDTVVEVLAGRRGSYDNDFFRVDLDLTEKYRGENSEYVGGDMFEYAMNTLFLGEED